MFQLTLTQAEQLLRVLGQYEGLDLLQYHLEDQLKYAEDEVIEFSVLDHEIAEFKSFLRDFHDFNSLYRELN
jgi:hypothetical protein